MWIKGLEQNAPALAPGKGGKDIAAADSTAGEGIERTASEPLKDHTIMAGSQAQSACCADALEEVRSSTSIRAPERKK